MQETWNNRKLNLSACCYLYFLTPSVVLCVCVLWSLPFCDMKFLLSMILTCDLWPGEKKLRVVFCHFVKFKLEEVNSDEN